MMAGLVNVLRGHLLAWALVGVLWACAASAFTVTVDGNPADWTGPGSVAPNHGMIRRLTNPARGYYVWSDPVGDHVAGTNNPDLTELRITADSANLYVMARFAANVVTSGSQATQLQIILGPRTNLGLLSAFDATGTVLAEGGSIRLQTRFAEASESNQVQATTLLIIASNMGSAAAAGNTIELSVPWAQIQGLLTALVDISDGLRFTVAVGRSDGVLLEPTRAAITDVVSFADSTALELADNVVDYNFRLLFERTFAGDVISPLQIAEVYPTTVRQFVQLQSLSLVAEPLPGYKIGTALTRQSAGSMQSFTNLVSGLQLSSLAFFMVGLTRAQNSASSGNCCPDAALSAVGAVGCAFVPILPQYTAWATGVFTGLDPDGDRVVLLDEFDTIVDVMAFGSATIPGYTGQTAYTNGFTGTMTRCPTNDNTHDALVDFELVTPVNAQCGLDLLNVVTLRSATPCPLCEEAQLANALLNPSFESTQSQTVLGLLLSNPASWTFSTTCATALGLTLPSIILPPLSAFDGSRYWAPVAISCSASIRQTVAFGPNYARLTQLQGYARQIEALSLLQPTSRYELLATVNYVDSTSQVVQFPFQTSLVSWIRNTLSFCPRNYVNSIQIEVRASDSIGVGAFDLVTAGPLQETVAPTDFTVTGYLNQPQLVCGIPGRITLTRVTTMACQQICGGQAVTVTLACSTTVTVTDNFDGTYFIDYFIDQPDVPCNLQIVVDGVPMDLSAWPAACVDIGPLVTIATVTPDPRSTAVSSIAVNFNVAVTGFDLGDLTLTRDTVALDLTSASLVATSGSAYTLSNIAALTTAVGAYELSVRGFGSGIRAADAAAAFLTRGDTEAWAKGDPITATFAPVSPDPRSAAVSAVDVVFNFPVSGFDVADLALTRDGSAVPLTGVLVVANSASGYSVTNLGALTAADGSYVLSLAAAGSNIVGTTFGLPLSTDASESWAKLAGPTVAIQDISSPQTAAVNSVTMTFSEAVAGFALADLALTRNGGATNLLAGSAATLTPLSPTSYLLDNLAGITNQPGAYLLSLDASSAGITGSSSSLPLIQSASEDWLTDIGGPVADFEAVVPNPRSAPVGSTMINFDKEVTGFTISDLTLTRNGGADLLAGSAATLEKLSALSYRLSGLELITSTSGDYEVSLVALGSGIQASVNGVLVPMVQDASELWQTQSNRPVAAFEPVVPDPRATPVAAVAVAFSVPVSGVDIADFALQRSGVAVSLSSASVAQDPADPARWIISGLTALTGSSGDYVLSLVPDGSIVDVATLLALIQASSEEWTAQTNAVSVAVQQVSSPSSAPVDSLTFTFSEPVVGFDLADITLTRGTSSNLLASAAGASLTQTGAQTYLLSGLAGLTQLNGDYVVTLTAAMSGISGIASAQPLVGDGLSLWSMVGGAPSASFAAVTPSPRLTPLPDIVLSFSDVVTGFDIADLRLTRNGQLVTLPASVVIELTSPTDYTIRGLDAVTAPLGSYVLTLVAAGSGILAASGSALGVDAAAQFAVVARPTMVVGPITPDPRSSPVDFVDISFSEPVSGLTISDLSLARNGVPVALLGAPGVALIQVSPSVVRLTGLAQFTAGVGAYSLAVDASNGNIRSTGTGFAVQTSGLDSWSVVVGPFARFTPITPDPANSVQSVELVLSEPVNGLDIGDLALFRNGDLTVNLLAGSGASLVRLDDLTYVVSNLPALANGSYEIVLVPAGSNIVAVASGVPLSERASEQFAIDASVLAARFTPVTPDPTDSVSSIEVVFTAPVTGVDLADFRLYLNGDTSNNLLARPGVSLVRVDESTYIIAGIDKALVGDGVYSLVLEPANSGIQTLDGTRQLSSGAQELFTIASSVLSARFTPVSPDPTDSVSEVFVTFSAPVTGVDLADFRLYLNGDTSNNLLARPGVRLERLDATRFVITGLNNALVGDGAYRLLLVAQGSGIRSADGTRTLEQGAAEDFGIDSGSLSARFTPVSPDPTDSVSEVFVTFSVPVMGVDLADFRLYLNGDTSYNLLARPGVSLVRLDLTSFAIRGLDNALVGDGAYRLLLVAQGSGIRSSDGRQQVLREGAVEDFAIALQALTVRFTPVTPDPTDLVTSIEVVFSRPVVGVDLGDFVLFVNGDTSNNLLAMPGVSIERVDESTYVIRGLDQALIGDGLYLLQLNPVGSGIQTPDGQLSLTEGAEEIFFIASSVLSAAFTPVTPDPTDSVSQLEVTFSVDVTGVDLADFALYKDGDVDNDLFADPRVSLTLVSGDRFIISGLQPVLANGAYRAVLSAAGSDIQSTDGRKRLESPAVEDFVIDNSLVSARFVPVDPDPTDSVSEVEVVFSVPVTGVDLADFRLYLNGDTSNNLLARPGVTLRAIDASRYLIVGLEFALAGPGSYRIVLEPSGSGIVSVDGSRRLTQPAVESFTLVNAADILLARFDAVVPDQRMSAVNQVTVRFSQPATGVRLGAFELRAGGVLIRTPAARLRRINSSTYRVSNLRRYTGRVAAYSVSLPATGSGIRSAAMGIPLSNTASVQWVTVAPVLLSFSVEQRRPVEKIRVIFSERVLNADVADLQITIFGREVLDLSQATLEPVSDTEYELTLAPGTAVREGDYRITLSEASDIIQASTLVRVESKSRGEWRQLSASDQTDNDNDSDDDDSDSNESGNDSSDDSNTADDGETDSDGNDGSESSNDDNNSSKDSDKDNSDKNRDKSETDDSTKSDDNNGSNKGRRSAGAVRRATRSREVDRRRKQGNSDRSDISAAAVSLPSWSVALLLGLATLLLAL